MYLVTGASGFIGKDVVEVLGDKIRHMFHLAALNNMTVDGIVNRKKRVATRLGVFGEVSYAIAPKFIDRILNTGFRLFPDSPKKGKEGEQGPPRPEALAFAHIMHGIHW